MGLGGLRDRGNRVAFSFGFSGAVRRGWNFGARLHLVRVVNGIGVIGWRFRLVFQGWLEGGGILGHAFIWLGWLLDSGIRVGVFFCRVWGWLFGADAPGLQAFGARILGEQGEIFVGIFAS